MTPPTVLRRERDGGVRRSRCSPVRTSRKGGGSLLAQGPESPRTLDDVIVGAWAGLRADAPTACPVCNAVLEPRWSAGAGVVGGRCRRCGSELA